MPDIVLVGEQNLVLTLPVQNPVLIKGAAGSGKTTVAVYRARHLLQTQQDLFRANNVIIFSYANSLVDYVRTLIGNQPCRVSTLHSFAGGLLRNLHVEKSTDVLAHYIHTAVAQARAKHGTAPVVLNKPTDFYTHELEWIKGRCIKDLGSYRGTARIGRGTADRVTAQDKDYLWSVFEGYNHQLATAHTVDYADLILCALGHVESPTFTPPFAHIVVDEAQDMTLAQLQLIAKLVSRETKSITLVADAAQRIYQSGFSWSETGLSIHGSRSFEFKRNYRNTRQIAAAAISLLTKEEDRVEFSEGELPEREGEKPRLVHAGSFSHQLDCIVETIRQPTRIGGIAIAAPNRKCARELGSALTAAGIEWVSLAKCPPNAPIVLDTMYAVKGIEFDHVILCDLTEKNLQAATGLDEDDAHSRLRKLLYVGMTRARKTLTLCTSGTPSRLLSDIDPTTLTIRTMP